MEAVYNVEFFSGELALINDPTIRQLTRETLEAAPAYIWYVPASITGKHHPPDDNYQGGLCWHLRKTSWVAYRMFNNLLLDTDIGIAAGLLHDIAHRGLEDEPEEGYDSYQKHGELAITILSKATTLVENNETWDGTWTTIMECIMSHMGRWGNIKPKTVEQVTFHLADVAASTKGLVSVGTIHAADVGKEGYSVSEIVGRRQFFIEDEEGELVFDFGKVKGKRLSDLVRESNSFITWILGKGVESKENPKGFPGYMINQIKEARRKDLEERRRKNEMASLSGTLFDQTNQPIDIESGPFDGGL